MVTLMDTAIAEGRIGSNLNKKAAAVKLTLAAQQIKTTTTAQLRSTKTEREKTKEMPYGTQAIKVPKSGEASLKL